MLHRPPGTPLRLAIVLAGLFASGCCQFATVSCWHPAGIDVDGIESLAIVEFSGEHGDQIAAALRDRLTSRSRFTVVPSADLQTDQHAACTQATTEAAWLAQARERGVDAVLLGTVDEYRCDDDLSDRLPAALAGNGDDVNDPPLQAAILQRGTLQRDAAITVSFRLLDAQTGAVRAEKSATHNYQHQAESPRERLTPRREVLAQLTEQCVDDFVAVLAPHPQQCEMKLARGGWYGLAASNVRSGNKRATVGNWDAARDDWQAAVDRDAECDAALYNLAIDAAHRQQFARAEELAMQAIRLRHTETYAAGLERIRLSRSGYDALQEHRDPRVLQASVSR